MNFHPEESPLSLRKMPAEDDTKLHRVCGDYIRQTLLAACRRPFFTVESTSITRQCNTPTMLVPLRSALRQIPARIRWFKLSISLMFFCVKVRSIRPNVVSSGILSQPAARLKTRLYQTITIERIERAPPTMPTTDKMTMSTASLRPVSATLMIYGLLCL